MLFIMILYFLWNVFEYLIFLNKIKKPVINQIANFLTSEECFEIINLCETSKNKVFKPSGTTSGNINFYSSGRTSHTLSFKAGEQLLIDNVRNRVSTLLNINENCMESVQITKYSKGQEYKYHWDYFKDDVPNQRKDTILIYLNSLSNVDGGTTKFYYGDSICPVQGLLLHWENIDENGNRNINTLHSGQPIKSNVTKYILTIWTRQRSLTKIN